MTYNNDWKPEKNISSPWDADVWETNVGQPVKPSGDNLPYPYTSLYIHQPEVICECDLFGQTQENLCFYDKLWGLLNSKIGDDVDTDETADRVRDLIRENIPEPKKGPGLPEYSIGFNECIRQIKNNLQ